MNLVGGIHPICQSLHNFCFYTSIPGAHSACFVRTCVCVCARCMHACMLHVACWGFCNLLLRETQPRNKCHDRSSTAAKRASTEKWIQISVLEDNHQAGSSVQQLSGELKGIHCKMSVLYWTLLQAAKSKQQKEKKWRTSKWSENSIRDSPRRMHHPRPRYETGSAAESLSCLSSYASYACTGFVAAQIQQTTSD